MKIGQFNTLRVQQKSAYGLVLGNSGQNELVLPATESPAALLAGDELEVFVYSDGDGEPQATIRKPLVLPGHCALLSITAISDAGIWLDWGLRQDLLLPRSEQGKRQSANDVVGGRLFVYVFLDPQTRKICASTRLHRYFSEDGSQFRMGETVNIVITEKSRLGFKALIDNQVLGLLFADQTHREPVVGEQMQAYIRQIRSDGKVDLTLYKKNQRRDKLEERIIEHLKKSGGSSTLSDTSTPEEIYSEFLVSKKQYKRTLGNLYKARKVSIKKNLITLIEDEIKGEIDKDNRD